MRCPDFRGCDVGCLGQPNVVPFLVQGIMVRMRIKSHASLFKCGAGLEQFLHARPKRDGGKIATSLHARLITASSPLF